MTDRIRRSIKRTDSSDSDYVESDIETVPVEGQRVQLNLLACLNTESSELAPALEQKALGQRLTQGLIINMLTWLNKELYGTQVNVFGCEFNLKQLIDATKNFSPKMEIQRGPSGFLYKAHLPNQSVVVEKIHHGSNGNAELRREVLLRKDLEHENIVKMLDGCSTKSLHLLIYEHMENGSLQQALFEQYPTKLDWRTRYNICLGVARGLRHLHDNNRLFRFVHGSIKPSNIMLDGNFNAKLTQFVSERLLYDDHDPFQGILQRSSRIMYMAPEYALGRPITPQADVYSFGIVLLEIVSGRCCVEFRSNQEAYFLLDEAYCLHKKGRLLDLVDKSLASSYDNKQASVILILAVKCIAPSPSLRPTMTDVVKILEGEKAIQEISKENLFCDSGTVSESRGLIQPSGELIEESESGKDILDFDSFKPIHDSKLNEPTQDPTPLSSSTFQPMENFHPLTNDETLVNHGVFNSVQDELPSGINGSNQDMVSDSIHIENPLKINSLDQSMDPTDLDTSEVISVIHADSSSLNPGFSTFTNMLESSELDLHNSKHVSQLLNFVNEELTKHPRDDFTPILEYAKINLTNLQQVTSDSTPIDLSTNSDITIALDHSNIERSNAQSRIATLQSEISRLEAELAATKRELQEEESSLNKLEVEIMELQNKKRLVSSYQMADVYVNSLKSSLDVLKSFYQ